MSVYYYLYQQSVNEGINIEYTTKMVTRRVHRVRTFVFEFITKYAIKDDTINVYYFIYVNSQLMQLTLSYAPLNGYVTQTES